MIDVVKIVIIGLVGTFLAITVKEERPEIAIGVSLSCGVIILAICIQPFYSIIGSFEALCNKTGIDFVYFTTILKIIGISYIAQLAAQTAEDSGQKSIATKIDFAGKIAIIVLAIPILQGIIDLLMELANT